jgi:hypothetical protein
MVFNVVEAQLQLQTFVDVGEHSVSEGLYVKNIFRGSFNYQTYNIEVGTQFDYKNNNPNLISGVDLIGSKRITVKNFPFDIKSYFILNRFSDLMYETNWGLRADTRIFDHFEFELGTNFKTYVINSSATNEYEINDSDRKLRENFNFIYTATAFLKPHDCSWNIGLSCTNIDYYVINQSTNPVFNLQMSYKPKPNLTLRLDSWYKQAGMLNINANHFAYFFRGGIIWEI